MSRRKRGKKKWKKKGKLKFKNEPKAVPVVLKKKTKCSFHTVPIKKLREKTDFPFKFAIERTHFGGERRTENAKVRKMLYFEKHERIVTMHNDRYKIWDFGNFGTQECLLRNVCPYGIFMNDFIKCNDDEFIYLLSGQLKVFRKGVIDTKTTEVESIFEKRGYGNRKSGSLLLKLNDDLICVLINHKLLWIVSTVEKKIWRKLNFQSSMDVSSKFVLSKKYPNSFYITTFSKFKADENKIWVIKLVDYERNFTVKCFEQALIQNRPTTAYHYFNKSSSLNYRRNHRFQKYSIGHSLVSSIYPYLDSSGKETLIVCENIHNHCGYLHFFDTETVCVLKQIIMKGCAVFSFSINSDYLTRKEYAFVGFKGFVACFAFDGFIGLSVSNKNQVLHSGGNIDDIQIIKSESAVTEFLMLTQSNNDDSIVLSKVKNICQEDGKKDLMERMQFVIDFSRNMEKNNLTVFGIRLSCGNDSFQLFRSFLV